MSMGDKIKHAAEEAVGKVKETAGKVTGDENLRGQGSGRPGQGRGQADRRQGQGRRQGCLRQLTCRSSS